MFGINKSKPYDGFKPSEKTIITPVLEKFEAIKAEQGFVPLLAFYPDNMGIGSDYCVLVEVIGTRIDVRYLYVGWKLQHVYGYDLTGERISLSLPKSFADDAMASYRRTALTREAQLEKRKIFFKGFIPFRYQRLLLPLSDDGKKVTHVLVYIVPMMWWIRSRNDLKIKKTAKLGDK